MGTTSWHRHPLGRDQPAVSVTPSFRGTQAWARRAAEAISGAATSQRAVSVSARSGGGSIPTPGAPSELRAPAAWRLARHKGQLIPRVITSQVFVRRERGAGEGSMWDGEKGRRRIEMEGI